MQVNVGKCLSQEGGLISCYLFVSVNCTALSQVAEYKYISVNDYFKLIMESPHHKKFNKSRKLIGVYIIQNIL